MSTLIITKKKGFGYCLTSSLYTKPRLFGGLDGFLDTNPQQKNISEIMTPFTTIQKVISLYSTNTISHIQRAISDVVPSNLKVLDIPLRTHGIVAK
jgi:hypothetical protein